MVSISYLFHEHNEFAHLVDHFEQNDQFSKMSSNFVHIYEHCHFNLRILFFPFYMSTSNAHVKNKMLESCPHILLDGTLFAYRTKELDRSEIVPRSELNLILSVVRR